ncbi:hypothetical protein EFS28_03810 [Lactobacillus acidophilus]|nr:hypothetical protein [Lactobacillus acidophilus]MCT3623372.1 hypothetical protein [Lactobacillus acidophilus]
MGYYSKHHSSCSNHYSCTDNLRCQLQHFLTPWNF